MKRLLALILVCCLVWVLCAQEHPTGVLRSSQTKSPHFAEYPEVPIRTASQTRGGDDSLPESVQNLSHLPVVGSQGSMGICGSFAPTYYLGNYYLSLREGAGRYNSATNAAVMISPMWSVHMFRHGGTGTQPNGGDPVDSIRGLCEQGYLTWQEMPFDGTGLDNYFLPSAEAQKTALTRRLGGYGTAMSDITTDAGLAKLKHALSNGDVFVAVTAPIPLNFDQYPNENAAWGEDAQSNNNGVFAWPAGGSTRESHAVTIVGYDDTKPYVNKEGEEVFGALLAVNSWGTGWGVKVADEGGYIWLGYESFQKYGFLEGTCYSLHLGEKGYAPTRTATILVETDAGESPWHDSASRFWLGDLAFSLNGHALENPIPGNSYLTGCEENPLTAEVLVDLSGYEDLLFKQFGFGLSFVDDAKLGVISSMEVHDGEGESLWRKDLGFELKAYSSSYPNCSYYINPFEEEGSRLPEIYPHTGSFALGDLNGDGRLDAVASVRQGKSEKDSGCEFITQVFLCQADGAWQSRDLELFSEGAGDLLLVDLDNDDVLDIAATDGVNACFLKNDGTGTFSSLAGVEIGAKEDANYSPGCFATADFDNDGNPDFALINGKNVVVIRQETSLKYTVFPIGKRLVDSADFACQGKCLSVGDVNGDGWTDVVVVGCLEGEWENRLVIYRNNGDMTFTAYVLPFGDASFTSLDCADADQDGCADILCVGQGQALILKGRADVEGQFQLPAEMPIGSTVEANYGGNVGWCDLDMDGRMEAVFAGTTATSTGDTNSSDPYGEKEVSFPLNEVAKNYLKILRWDGSQYVDSGVTLPGTVGFAGPSILCFQDVDGDGRPDIVHGGCFGYKSTVFAHQGPNRSVCGMKYLRNALTFEVPAANAPTAGNSPTTTGTPSPSAEYPEEITALPEYTVTCVSEDTNRGTVETVEKCTYGDEVTLRATANAGWRFAYWEGGDGKPKRLQASMAVKLYGDADFTAHFVPEDGNLKIDETNLGYRDDSGNLWFYEEPFSETPQFASATGCTFFALAKATAFYDRIGSRAWNQRLLRALDGTLWFEAAGLNFGDSEGIGGYMEQTQKAWGGPGGLAVRYDYENTSSLLRGLAIVYANYADTLERTVPDKEEVVCCAPQRNYLLMLTASGRIRFSGLNDAGQFGAAAPYRVNEYAEISGLPDVFAIATGGSFAAAIDCEGDLWTWGDNRHGQLGRDETSQCFVVPGKVTGLSSKAVAIAAGESHLAVLCADGTMRLWGDNSLGQLGSEDGQPLKEKQIVAITAAGNRTAAMDEDGVIYLWGDGQDEPVAIDNTDFETVTCQIKVDDRAAALLSEDSGNRVARKDAPVEITASSTEDAVFQYWLVDGVQNGANPLTITPSQGTVIEAVYQLKKPLVSFGEPVMTDTSISVDVTLSQTEQEYDGGYFAFTHSANMPIQELQFSAWPKPREVLRFDSANEAEGTLTTEFYIHNTTDRGLFKTSDPMFKIVFARPAQGVEAYADWAQAPVFARNLGEAGDEADTGSGFQIALDNPEDLDADALFASFEVAIPDSGDFGYLCIPGDAGAETLEDLENLLLVEGFRGWSWDGEKMISIPTLQPWQTAIFSVSSKEVDSVRFYYQPTEAEKLNPGWNLVVFPEETALPEEATGSFVIDDVQGVFRVHDGPLQPGKPYWLYVKE